MKSPAKKSYREVRVGGMELAAEEKEGTHGQRVKPPQPGGQSSRKVIAFSRTRGFSPSGHCFCGQLVQDARANSAKRRLTAVAALPRPLAAAEVRVPPKPDAVRHRRVHALRALALQVKRSSVP